MAVINKSIKEKIVKYLIKSNFENFISELKKEISDILEKGIVNKIPCEVLKVYKEYPDLFWVIDSITITKSFSEKHALSFHHDNTNYYFDLSKSYPIVGARLISILDSIFDSNVDDIYQKFDRYISLLRKKENFKKRLECVLYNTIFTPKKLQQEFPEAYEAFLKATNPNDDEKGINLNSTSNNLCDNIENLRAELNSKSNEKSVQTPTS